ncbi:creatininase family protein [Marivibrio halodurans]|uniref:Creatininase family protein n=1 Tax=Marivibrio halodurans TaxID=2039722 RepID=A0A8J7V0J5_9PROT|nr:creatininase family protein [Marivibrio halodurans]
MPAPVIDWTNLKTTDFAALDPERTVALLPVGAVEQHGPHLPLGTDTIILESLIDGLADRLAGRDITVLRLPTQAIGDSVEHAAFPGTLAHDAETLIATWTAIGEAVADAGPRKIAIVNSHGGQPQIVDIVAMRLRRRRAMLAARIMSYRFGAPEGTFAADELAFGYHGGEVETSLMLAIAPHLVAMDRAEAFDSLARGMARENTVFRAEGAAGFAWMAQDLNPAGAMGNAADADAERGRRTRDHMRDRLADALTEVAAFPLSRLRGIETDDGS